MASTTPIVFFVEDDPLMIRMYERIFKLNNIEVVMVFDGEQAIAKLPTLSPKPSVVLLDVMMPKMNGFQVLEFIKNHPELKDIPVFLLSNLAGKEDAERALAMGAKEYLVKSEFQPKEVVEKIKALLSV
jgi:CheY-like chemotaxis protein